MSERPRSLCPTCGKAIEPEETDVVEAFELVTTGGFGDPHDVGDGLEVAFHEPCFPLGNPYYRRAV